MAPAGRHRPGGTAAGRPRSRGPAEEPRAAHPPWPAVGGNVLLLAAPLCCPWLSCTAPGEGAYAHCFGAGGRASRLPAQHSLVPRFLFGNCFLPCQINGHAFVGSTPSPFPVTRPVAHLIQQISLEM